MFREMTYSTRLPFERQVRWIDSAGASPAEDDEFPVDNGSPNRVWHEDGNPCIGIVVGCVLSVPLWAGLLTVLYLLR